MPTAATAQMIDGAQNSQRQCIGWNLHHAEKDVNPAISAGPKL